MQETTRHRVEIYHRISSTGLYYAGCLCGWKSEEVHASSEAWRLVREGHFYPEEPITKTIRP